jgi:hypothetical protein
MTTFDLPEVRGFVAGVEARINRCENGEGMDCADLEDSLHLYAKACCEFRNAVRLWGQEVFSTRVAFDPEVERLFRERGYVLLTRAAAVFDRGRKVEDECYTFSGRNALGAALWELYQLLNGWVPPQPSISPSARQGFVASDPSIASEALRRLHDLPRLPATWQPPDPRQRQRLAQSRRS